MKRFFLALLVLSASFAGAEKADREKPINLDAQRGTYDGLNNVQILEGDVTISQGTMHITASRAEIRRDSENYIAAVATGSPVTFKQKREGCEQFIEAFADRAEFDERKDTLKLISRARLKNGADEIAGDLIVYNSETEYFEVLGDRAAAAKTDGRVRMVIQPKDKADGKSPCGTKSTPGKKPAVK
jgi:lipopolysaccharide export system protein LptA